MGTKVYDNYADLITFNRNSRGTALRPIGYGDELVTNGTFDTDVSGWNITSGDGSLIWNDGKGRLTGGTGNTFIAQTITIASGRVVRISYDPTAVSATKYSLRVNGVFIETNQTTFEPRIQYLYVASANIYVELIAYAGETIDWDNISVKEVLFDREGDPLTLFLHPEGVPRIEYDADRNLKGLLIEPTAQNLLTYSEDFSQWAPTNVTVATDTTVSPNGSTLAYSITGVGGASPKRIGKGHTTPSTTHTFSVFAKAGTNNFIQLLNSGDGDAFCNFDLSSGSVGSEGAKTTGVITNYGNGWYRCEARFASIVASTNSYIYLANNSSATYGSAALTTGSAYLWGAQVEAGPIATSYMPTTGSPFTRGKDEASMTNVSGLIGQKEGTLYLEVDWKAASGTIQVLLEADDGTGSNRILIYNTSGDALFMYARAGGATPATNQGVSSSAYSGIQKIAYAYKTDDFELYVNGSSVSSNTSGSLAALATLTDIDLGQDYAANVQANMHIRAVQIIPRRLSDAQLIELTS